MSSAICRNFQQKQAEKLKSREMKDKWWKMKDEWLMMKDERWRMKDEGWRFWAVAKQKIITVSRQLAVTEATSSSDD